MWVSQKLYTKTLNFVARPIFLPNFGVSSAAGDLKTAMTPNFFYSMTSNFSTLLPLGFLYIWGGVVEG